MDETRLPPKEALILELLVAQPNLYGLEMIERADGALKRGTIYVLLGRLAERGYVESELEVRAWGARGNRRRRYRATTLGARVFRAWRSLQKAGAP